MSEKSRDSNIQNERYRWIIWLNGKMWEQGESMWSTERHMANKSSVSR